MNKGNFDHFPMIIPTRELSLNIDSIDLNKLKELTACFKGKNFHKINTTIRFFSPNKCSVKTFEKFMKALFDNLNIISLTLDNLKTTYLTKKFQRMIHECKLLRNVKFEKWSLDEGYLEMLRQNSHIKQWHMFLY